MYFCVNEFEACVNDSIFSGNEQQKVCYCVLKRCSHCNCPLNGCYCLCNCYYRSNVAAATATDVNTPAGGNATTATAADTIAAVTDTADTRVGEATIAFIMILHLLLP